MKLSLGPVALSLVAAACASSAFLACNDDGARAPFDYGTDSGGASLPDASAAGDGGVADASNDAKGPFDPADEAVVCTTTPCAMQLVAGERHFCARMADGTVRCWGDDAKGSLGISALAGDAGSADASADGGAPFVVGAVSGLTGASRISAGGTTTCALIADGGVRCWGGNDTGQLGLTIAPATFDDDPHPAPKPVASALTSAGTVTRVDVGQRSACAVLTTGKVWCWGDNTQRQLARETADDVGGPAEAQLGGLALASVLTGTNTGLGVTTAGDVVSWGAVAGKEGSVAARTASVSPDVLPLSIELGPTTSLSVSSTTYVQPTGGGFPRPPPQGVAHACAVVKGDVFCWGVSLTGALGTGLPEPAPSPTPAVVQSEKAWPQQVSTAGDITCVRLTDGSVQCTGDNTRGALGKDPKDAYSMFFRRVDGFNEHAVQIVTSAASVCALVQGGRVVCWGSNEHGELATGAVDEEPHPTPLPVRF